MRAHTMSITLAPAPRHVGALNALVASPHFSANRLLVRLTGSSTSIARALHASFDPFSSSSTGTFFQITRAARLPQALAGNVSAVLGLSSLGRFATPRPAQRSAAGLSKGLGAAKSALGAAALAAPSINYPGEYGPKDFWAMYDAPSTQTGSGQQLAIITEGDVRRAATTWW